MAATRADESFRSPQDRPPREHASERVQRRIAQQPPIDHWLDFLLVLRVIPNDGLPPRAAMARNTRPDFEFENDVDFMAFLKGAFEDLQQVDVSFENAARTRQELRFRVGCIESWLRRQREA